MKKEFVIARNITAKLKLVKFYIYTVKAMKKLVRKESIKKSIFKAFYVTLKDKVIAMRRQKN